MCQNKERCTVLLMAAGSGLRMGGGTRKQYIDVKGRPLFTYSLETFDRSDIITDIMIVVPEGDQEYCREIGLVTMSLFMIPRGLSSMMTQWEDSLKKCGSARHALRRFPPRIR